MRDINKSDSMLVFADKTTNLYSMKKDEYEKLLHENVTKTYQKSTDDIRKSINREAKKMAEEMKLDDKMEVFADRKAFITLKDHKENFLNHPKCRLVNPAKTELGLVSEQILEKVNKAVLKVVSVNQWKNTNTVINWFKNIKRKEACSFIKFDIVEFYPSISENLLMKAIEFAQTYAEIN